MSEEPENKLERVERFAPGRHPDYPDGCVVVTIIDPDDVETVTEHTLEAWDNSQN